MLSVALRCNRSVAEKEYAELHAAIDPDSSLRGSDAADAFVGEIESLCNRLGRAARLLQLGVLAADIPERS